MTRRLFFGAAVAAALTPGFANADPALTNATLYRADGTGTNTSSSLGNPINFGAWTTVLHQQNVPGNYGGQLFVSTQGNPGPSEYLSPAASLSVTLGPGANTFFFWGDGDDTRGGGDAFGLNLFLNGAASSSPSISAFTAPGTAQILSADGSPICTAGFDFVCAAGSGHLSVLVDGSTITLTDFEVLGVGGATVGLNDPSCVDRVNLSNTIPFTPPPHSNGICDTHGRFTLTVTAPSAVSEPASLVIFGGGLAGLGLIRRLPRRLAAGSVDR